MCADLDPSNYKEYKAPATEKRFSAFLERPKNRRNRETTIEWSNQPTSTKVITGRIGVRGQAKTAKKPRKLGNCFLLMK